MKKRKVLNRLDVIRVVILTILVAVVFSVGYFISWRFIQKPLDESQLAICEQIAHDVYEQKGQVIFEVPEGYSLDISLTEIIVSSDFSRGKVVASLRDGVLVLARDLEIAENLAFNIIFGIVLVFFLLVILLN